MASSIAQKYLLLKQQHPLTIVEVGPGSGALAESILTFFSLHFPIIYSQMVYKCVDVSPPLLQRTLARVSQGHQPLLRRNGFRQTNTDFLSFCGNPLERPTFIVMCEILDNLPHDKLVKKDKQWQEAWVEAEGDSLTPKRETYQPLSDPDLQSLLQVW